ncbi:recombinase family protein [Actinocorallia sp. B10E7]|uniref:recombinase family protein n=1 Tax=Actinocorallia sp. B10E7 TaxID=3153558 RepID=UPI00325C9E62
MIPVIGYIRVSTAREEMISPEIQQNAINAWAARTGRKIIEWIIDLDTSGRNSKRQVMTAIGRIETGVAREIAVYRYDRWGRNALESMANIGRLEAVGGQLQSATEPLDAETAIGRYSRTNALALAEMQSDLISENWRAALDNRLARGLPSHGTARYGYLRLGRILDVGNPAPTPRYRVDPNDPLGERYEPDYEGGTADVLADLYHRFIGGQGGTALVNMLHRAGILNATGKTWEYGALMAVLDSGFGAGLLRIHDSGCRCDKRKRKHCPNNLWLPGAHAPIIDTDTWEAYQEARQRRHRYAPRARAAVYPLSGLVRCGICYGGMVVTGGARHPSGYQYVCNRWKRNRDCVAASPSRARVEREVLAMLAEWSDDIDRPVVEERESVRIVPDTARLTQLLAAKDAVLVQLVKDRAADGGRTPAAVWDAARDGLLEERARIAEQLAQEPAEPVGRASFAPVMVGLLESWEVLAAEARREMLAQMIRHVIVRRGERRGHPEVVVTPVWEPCDLPCCQDS